MSTTGNTTRSTPLTEDVIAAALEADPTLTTLTTGARAKLIADRIVYSRDDDGHPIGKLWGRIHVFVDPLLDPDAWALIGPPKPEEVWAEPEGSRGQLTTELRRETRELLADARSFVDSMGYAAPEMWGKHFNDQLAPHLTELERILDAFPGDEPQ